MIDKNEEVSEMQILERLPRLTREQRQEFIHRLYAREQGVAYETLLEEDTTATLSVRDKSPIYAGENLQEMVDAAYLLSLEEQSDLLDHACAQEENMDVADFRERHLALMEALHDPHPGYSLEQVRNYLQECRDHAAGL